MDNSYKSCKLCPRQCGIDRYHETGFCGQGTVPRLARAALHFGEEPCISGDKGSGTVFFSGCNLGCVYCQNYKITKENFGEEVSVAQLGQIFLDLQQQGAQNINLVTATPFVPSVVAALRLVGDQLNVPIVYNTSGYEAMSTLKMLAGFVDIYLTDYKYFNNDIAFEYSTVSDYKEKTTLAIDEMLRQVGDPQFDENGAMTKGVIIRHLVLPSHRDDAINVMEAISRRWKDHVIVSLMRQFTPTPNCPKSLSRKVTSFEYNQVQRMMESFEIYRGYVQDRASAKAAYTPNFDLTGIVRETGTDNKGE